MKEMGSIEAPWRLRLDRLGPFIVDMDAQGGRLSEAQDAAIARALHEAYRRLGIPEDFSYTRLY